MITTNLLTALRFTEIPTPCPTTWDLTPYIPGGALLAEHVEARFTRDEATYSAWGPVTAWDQVTKTATYFQSGVVVAVEFRRVTPRTVAVLDPRLTTSRVSQRNLQVNADQGMFVAQEWAAEYAINVMTYGVPSVPGLNTLGLVQNTQNHWGAGADFSKKTWNFQLAGGYLDRSHVRAQAMVDGVWVQLDVSYDDEDPAAPFRFVGPFQLHLDLLPLGEITGLVIYRHTPRNGNVGSPLDNSRITAGNMEPSARHALFVAVEVGELLARAATQCNCADVGGVEVPPLPPVVNYTSLLLPFEVTETMQYSPASLQAGLLVGFGTDPMSYGVPTLMSGSLAATIAYLSYTTEVVPMSYAVPTLMAGTLDVTIAYQSYTTEVVPMSYAVPALLSGTLDVTIAYVSYTTEVVPMSYGVPTLISGTLT